MQLRILPAAIIYIGSYLPLSMILMIQDFKPEALNKSFCTNWVDFFSQCQLPLEHPLFSILAILICALCFISAIGSLFLNKPSSTLKLVNVKYIPSDLMNYVLPYIVSFISLDYGDVSKLLGFLLFLAWLFLITYRSGLIIMNPVFAVFGWRLYEVDYSYLTSDKTHQATVLSRKRLANDETHQYEIIQDIFIIKK